LSNRPLIEARQTFSKLNESRKVQRYCNVNLIYVLL